MSLPYFKTFYMLSLTTSCAETLLLMTDRGMKVIPIATIIRVEAISNYSKLYFCNGKTLVVARVLQWFENVLPGNCFVRIHRTHLLNLQWMQTYRQTALQTVLYNGQVLPVSRRKLKGTTTAVSLWFEAKTPAVISSS